MLQSSTPLKLHSKKQIAWIKKNFSINAKGQIEKNGKVVGRIGPKGYMLICLSEKSLGINSRAYMAHRLVWLLTYGYEPTCNLDHIDRDRTNNSISNLRLANPQLNCRNKIARKSASGYRGVTWDNITKKWLVQITLPNHKRKTIGRYSDPIEAAKAFNSACVKYLSDLILQFQILNEV